MKTPSHLLIAALWVVASACEVGEGSTDDPSACDTCGPIPDLEIPTQGHDLPPTPESLLADDPVIEQASMTIAGTGDTLTLEDGFTLFAPAGSLPAGTTVTASHHPFVSADPNGGQAVYRVEASAELASPATLTFPIPGAQAGFDPSRAFVMYLHEDDPIAVFRDSVVDEDARTISVDAPSFSVFVPSLQSEWFEEPPSDRVVKAPYYNQRSTQNCWSMSLTMLLASYGAAIEPWENNAFFGLATEHGLKWNAFSSSNDIVEYIQRKVPGAEVERRVWWNIDGTGDTRAYLEKTLREGRPVMVWYYADEQGDDAPHMVLFVGLDGDSYVIHDPSVAGYVRKTWAQITPRFISHGILDWDWAFAPDGTATLALRAPATETPWEATVLAPHTKNRGEGVSFVRRNEARNGWEAARARSWIWYAPSLGGAALVDPELNPGNITLGHRMIVTLGVANVVDGSEARTFDVGMELLSGDTRVGRPISTQVSAAGGQSVDAILAAVDGHGRPVRDLVTEAGAYTARFWVARGGQRFDTADIPVTIEDEDTGGVGEPPSCRVGDAYCYYCSGPAAGPVDATIPDVDLDYPRANLVIGWESDTKLTDFDLEMWDPATGGFLETGATNITYDAGERQLGGNTNIRSLSVTRSSVSITLERVTADSGLVAGNFGVDPDSSESIHTATVTATFSGDTARITAVVDGWSGGHAELSFTGAYQLSDSCPL